jgi:hypothetical protein
VQWSYRRDLRSSRSLEMPPLGYWLISVASSSTPFGRAPLRRRVYRSLFVVESLRVTEFGAGSTFTSSVTRRIPEK